MALIVKDRVLETCSTSGLVDFTLTGAVTGYQRFSAIGNGNTTYYAAYVIGSNDWEVGIGTVGTSSLTRDTILSSSTGSKVNFAGNPVVWCDLPSSKAIFGDANNNISVNSIFEGFTSVGASGTQIVLTASSTPYYLVTGSGGQTIKLPDATTLPLGAVFDFNNNQSSGAITVNNNSNTLVASIPSGGYTSVILTANSTAAGSWDRHDQAPSNVSWSTNTFDYPGSITSATWNGSTVAVNRGGTGQTTFTAGQVLYGNGTSGLSTSANMTFDGTKLTLANDVSIHTLTAGLGGGNISTNTGFGYQVLNASASGTNNSGYGYQALKAILAGSNNTASGTYSQASVNSGAYNTSSGVFSLYATTSGSYNAAFGNSALQNCNNSYNCAFGFNAGPNHNNSNCLMMGAYALQYNTVGSNLASVGYQSLNSNTTNVATLGSITAGSGYTNGTYTGVAMSAVSGATFLTYPTVTVVVAGGVVNSVTLVTNGVGASSTAATVLTVAAALIGGTGSGFSIPVASFASGSNNTAFGYQAGFGNASANANTTGTNNTYLGYQTVGSAKSNTNEMVIGYQAVGLGSNTTVIGNTSVTLTQTYGVTKSTNYTVATLPSASTNGVGAKAFVTDALAPTFGTTVTGGGTVPVPVYSDGTNWKVG
jgi:hypothetical protein